MLETFDRKALEVDYIKKKNIKFRKIIGGNEVFYLMEFFFQATQEELDVEQAVEKQCTGKIIHKIWGHTLFHRDDLPFSYKQYVNELA